MRTPKDEITNLKAWVKSKKDEGRAEWAIGHLRDRGYRDYPEIEDPLERLLQMVAAESNYPRFKGVMVAMKQAKRSEDAEKRRSGVLVPLRPFVTEQQKALLIKIAKDNKESYSTTVGRLIDEAGGAQAKAEQRLAGRYKVQLEKLKSRIRELEKNTAKGTLPQLMRGRLANDLMETKRNHYQLEVMALQWLRELCQCHVQMASAGIRSPLLPDQLSAAEAMFDSTVNSLRFLGKPPEQDVQLQQLLDLGEMDFNESQQLVRAKQEVQAKKKISRKPRKISEAQDNRLTGGSGGPAVELGQPIDTARDEMPGSPVDNLVEGQQAVYKLSEKVAQVGNLARPGTVKETSQLPHWLDEEHRTQMRLASPNGCIDIRILSEAKNVVLKQDNLSHLYFKPTPEQLRRIVAGYLSQIAEP